MKLHSSILGEGKALVILHGFLGMSDNWKTIGRKYAENGFEVHLVDQRNHGRSPHSQVFNYEVMADDLKEYCNFHNLNNIYLLGHSMGGKTAMFAATETPELVDKLLIVDIGPKYYAPHHQDILEGLQAIEKEKLESRSEAEDILEPYVPDQGTKLFLLKNLYWKKKNELALRLNLGALVENVENIGQALEADRVFKKPTLFIKGENSNYIQEKDKKQLKLHFPESEVVEIKNAGHWVHAENMEDFFHISFHYLKS